MMQLIVKHILSVKPTDNVTQLLKEQLGGGFSEDKAGVYTSTDGDKTAVIVNEKPHCGFKITVKKFIGETLLSVKTDYYPSDSEKELALAITYNNINEFSDGNIVGVPKEFPPKGHTFKLNNYTYFVIVE